jgi:hypothetical protein
MNTKTVTLKLIIMNIFLAPAIALSAGSETKSEPDCGLGNGFKNTFSVEGRIFECEQVFGNPATHVFVSGDGQAYVWKLVRKESKYNDFYWRNETPDNADRKHIWIGNISDLSSCNGAWTGYFGHAEWTIATFRFPSQEEIQTARLQGLETLPTFGAAGEGIQQTKFCVSN